MQIKTSKSQLAKLAACIILLEKYKRLDDIEAYRYYNLKFYQMLNEFGMTDEERASFMKILIHSGVDLVEKFKKEMNELKKNRKNNDDN